MKKIIFGFLVAATLLTTGCVTEADPCETNNEGYIIVKNDMTGVDAEGLRVTIDDVYIADIAPGGETTSTAKTAGATYEVKGSAASGATFIKDITVEKCFEDVVSLGQ